MFAQWASRCLPGFSIIALIILLVLSSVDVIPGWKRPPIRDGLPGDSPLALNLAQTIFIVYTILVHLNTFFFTVRLSWALSYADSQTSKVLKRRNDVSTPTSSAPSSPRLSGDPFATGYTTRLDSKRPQSWIVEVAEAEITHAIILPNYNEDIDTLRTTLDVLASHPRARTQYEIYLAMEQKESGAAEKAEKLVSYYEKSFSAIQATFHPAGLPSEIAGKSSNVAFAARCIGQVHQAGLETSTSNVVLKVMDADTHLWQDYFTEIRRLHYTHSQEADRTLYSCPIIFDRNSNDSPVLVRCADLLWSFAGLSTMYPNSAVSIPTSVYSLPLTLASRVGGWDSDPTSIGEDMHMMLKCYFGTSGTLVSRVIHSPASQCNVSSDLPYKGYRRYLDTCVARYRQALRHMWGALDSGFAARQSFRSLQPANWRSFLYRPRHLALLHLLWEAHFLPCHLTILLVYSMVYAHLAGSTRTPLHPLISLTLDITSYLRLSSFIAMNVCISIYNTWYGVCLQTRKKDMREAGITDTGFSTRTWWHSQFLVERVVFPIAGTVFGAVPTLQAVFMHFATERLVYRVSGKPRFGAGGAGAGSPA
ncbi:glycosyl transferase family group 2-domain-containing protein [Aspergillus karnatakaensis]|uniref:glycosyltransferase family 2 protein n=1 Tax=Aspergillus karnatakaensis TaxID=1810916 RepID=UPI003CCD70D8